MAHTQNTHRCIHCEKRHLGYLSASVCCLFAPKPMGWCAWCGEETKRSFCKEACAISYRDDVLESVRKKSA